MTKQPITMRGTAHPLGATLLDEGVNFSLFAPFADRVEILLFEHENDTSPLVVELNRKENKSYYYWHCFIPHLKANQLYGYRVYGNNANNAGYCFDPSKVLVDPYAKVILGKNTRDAASVFGEPNLHNCLKSAVVNDEFNWELDAKPRYNLKRAIIYEMHLSGFTLNPNSGIGDEKRGTYLGVIEKIPYLKKLGVNTIEFLPIHAFDPDDAPDGRQNYWGYSPINFFAPHAAYAFAKTPQGIVDEFKLMIKELHKADIQVILDVVYNHTTENDKDGPIYNFKGISNPSYYLLDDNGEYKNFTGTGNSMNSYHSVCRRMILDSLKYWVNKMRIDGFRFDLASVLARDEDGEPINNPPLLWSIESEPELSDTLLIAEPWDAGGLYQVFDFVGDRWAIWDGHFRDVTRKFLKSNEGMVYPFSQVFLGSPIIQRKKYLEYTPDRNIHFITAHDGFTLNDLVSYNHKNNWDNGEENRDGTNDNHSWNCGAEGQTDDPSIEALRLKQIKNALCMLFLSHGTPMLLMGDEIRNTQNGNNNAYCQSNPLTWFDWEQVDQENEIFEWVNQLIDFRQGLEIFAYPSYLDTFKSEHKPYVQFHGTQLFKADFSEHSRTLAIEMVYAEKNEHVYIIFNMFWERLEFELPPGVNWNIIFDTSTSGNTIGQESIDMEERSAVVLKSRID